MPQAFFNSEKKKSISRCNKQQCYEMRGKRNRIYEIIQKNHIIMALSKRKNIFPISISNYISMTQFALFEKE